MSIWAAIKKAVNSNLDTPLDYLIGQRADVADASGSLHAKARDLKTNLENKIENKKRMQVFTSNGIFTVPPGVNGIFITACGGGGGGSASRVYSTTSRPGGAGGGGAACVMHQIYSVTPGQSISITVGKGGKGSTVQTANGSAGQSTVISGLVTLPGGGGGQRSDASNEPKGGVSGGRGGGGGGDGHRENPSNGKDGVGGGGGAAYSYQGGGGGGSLGGGGGGGNSYGGYAIHSVYTTGGDGFAGTTIKGGDGSYGAGGGGGPAPASSRPGPNAGGDGGDGIVIIEW